MVEENKKKIDKKCMHTVKKGDEKGDALGVVEVDVQNEGGYKFHHLLAASLFGIVIALVIMVVLAGGLFATTNTTFRRGEVCVGEEYIIEACVVTRIDGHRLAKVYTYNEVDNSRVLFYLTGINDECASAFKRVKVGKDTIFFENVRHLVKRDSQEWGNMNYSVYVTPQPFRLTKRKTCAVKEKPSAIVNVQE